MTDRKRPDPADPYRQEPELGGFRPSTPPAPAYGDPEAMPRIARPDHPTHPGARYAAPGGPAHAAAPRPAPAPNGAPPPRYRHPPPPVARRSWAKVVGFGLLGVVALVVGAAAWLMFFTPVDFVRDRVAETIKKRTGRDLVVAGRPSLSFWPALAVSLSDVTLSNPPGLSGPPLVKVKTIDAEAEWRPLFSGDVKIARLVLRAPVITLSIDKQGRRNWQFADLPPSGTVRYAQAAGTASDSKPLPRALREFAQGATSPTPATPGRRLSPAVDDITLEDMRMVDGTFRFVDERNGTAEEARAVNMTFKADGFTAPLEAAGDFIWRGEKLDATAKLTPFRAVLENQPIEIAARLIGKPAEITTSGTLTTGEVAYAGKVAIKAASIGALTRWVGRPLGGGLATSPLSATANARLAGPRLALSDLDANAGSMATTGALTVDSGGARPMVKGNLRISLLDLDKITGTRRLDDKAPETTPSRPGGPDPNFTPKSIDDILNSGRKQVRGFTRRDGWSEDPVDLTGLGLFDADLKIAVGQIVAADFKAGPGAFTTTLVNKVGRLSFDEVLLYEGRARGVVTLDATHAANAQLATNLTLDGVEALSLLKAAAKVDAISGKARVFMALSARGASEKQLVETLTGKAELVMGSGAIVGVSVPKLLQTFAQGRLPSFERVPSDKTDFSELVGTAQVSNGVAKNQDLRVTTAHLRATGAGTINLPDRSLDYVIRPKFIGGHHIQVGQSTVNVGLLEIPLRATGTFDRLSIRPDFGGVFRSNQVGEHLRSLDAKDVEQTVRGVLGGDADSKAKARDFLKNLLKP